MDPRVNVDHGALRTFSHHVLVNTQYRLVLFTIPKAGSTQLIKLMRRLAGSPDWKAPPHYTADRPFLKKLSIDRVNDILNAPSWTKAVVLRDPVERLLSAYLDKYIHSRSYAARIFRPDGRGMPFEEFLGYVLSPNRDTRDPKGLHQSTDPHWRPQCLVGSVGQLESVMDFVGDFASIREWTEAVLQRVGAWEEYGASGWGEDGSESIFQSNSDNHRTSAGDRVAEFFDRQTLDRVYRAYADDIDFAARWNIDLAQHADASGP